MGQDDLSHISPQHKRKERAEYWGTTPPSMLATGGFIVAVISAFYVSLNWLATTICILAIIAIVVALLLDWRQGFDVKWRKANFFFHVFFLLASVLSILVRLYIGHALKG